MRRRAGFTITELLVALALIVFIVTILATAFSEAMKSFRHLKGIGDINKRFRTFSSLLTDDVNTDHFEGKKRISDPTFFSDGPPREGYFRIWQGSPSVLEGSDANGIPSVRATDHVLQFTVKKRGNGRGDFFTAGVPTGSPLPNYGLPDSRYQELPAPAAPNATFNTQWAEVAWFLRANGASAGSTPLYTLYRRQRAVVPTPESALPAKDLNWGTALVPNSEYAKYLEVSCRQRTSGGGAGSLYFNNPSDLTIPQYRFGMNPTQDGGIPLRADRRLPIFATSSPDPANPEDVTDPSQPPLDGADAVVPDVISFSVRISTTSVSAVNLTNGGAGYTAAPAVSFSGGGGSGAAATAVLAGDRVAAVVLTNGGSGYTTPPTVTIAAPPAASSGTQARATATIFSGDFMDVPPSNSVAGNPLFAAATGPFVFDSWTSEARDGGIDYSLWRDVTPASALSAQDQGLLNKRIPHPINIRALQIQLRVWDNKTEQARQITLVIDL